MAAVRARGTYCMPHWEKHLGEIAQMHRVVDALPPYDGTQRLRNIIPEADFHAYVTDLLDVGQWLWHHETDSRRSPKGFPDIVAVKGDRIVFIEVKRENGKLRPEQLLWNRVLRECVHAEVYVWRPSDADEARRVILG